MGFFFVQWDTVGQLYSVAYFEWFGTLLCIQPPTICHHEQYIFTSRNIFKPWRKDTMELNSQKARQMKLCPKLGSLTLKGR